MCVFRDWRPPHISFLGRYQPYWVFLRFILSYVTECFALFICAPCVFLWKLEEGVDPVDLKLRRWPYVFGTSSSRVQGSLSLTPLRGFIFSLLARDFISQSWQTTKRDDCTFLTQSATKDLACSALERIVWPVEGLVQEELLSLLSLGFKNWKYFSFLFHMKCEPGHLTKLRHPSHCAYFK